MVQLDTHLGGAVEDVSLADLLQLFHYGRKSVTLHVSGSQSGKVVMHDGEIRHAQCAEQQGEDALAALLVQRVARVRTSGPDERSPQTVQRAFGAVVLDLLRKHDELERDTSDLAEVARSMEEATHKAIEERLVTWLEHRGDVEHAALLDPREHAILACDSQSLWRGVVQSSLVQTLVAPYFDDSFSDLDNVLSPLNMDEARAERQTIVTFGGRRYVLGTVPERGWIAMLIFRTAQISLGLSLAHLAALQRGVASWLPVSEAPLDLDRAV